MTTGSLQDVEAEVGPSSTTPTGSGAQASATNGGGPSAPGKIRRREDGALTLVPAGFVGDILGSLSGTIGEITGGWFGNAALGKQIGDTASPFVKLLPFQVGAPSVAPQSTGPGGSPEQQGPQETLIVVPNAFLGGILGGIGGNLLGGTVGKWLGDEETGGDVGSAVGGFLGGLLPFQVVPPALMPQSTGPDGPVAPTGDEAMIVVPAGFFGNLLSGAAQTFSSIKPGVFGDVAGAASPFLKLLPFQAVPSEYAPQSAGPGGTQQEIAMTVLPAGFFGSLLSGMAESVGGAVGGLFGSSGTGAEIGKSVAPILNMMPFHAVPPGLVPQSTGPAGAPQEQMLFVPAGLFGSLLSGWGGTLNSLVSDWTGSSTAGDVAEGLAGILGDISPFSVLPQGHA